MPGQCHTLLPQHVHAVVCKKRLRPGFHAGPPLVVAVAPPDTQRRPQPAQLRDTVLQGVVLAGDEITGQHDEIGLHGIDHVDGTPDRRTGHEVADVEIAHVHDAQAIQTGWEMCQGNVDGNDAIPQPSHRGAIHHRQEGQPARQIRGVAEDRMPSRIDVHRLHGWEVRHGGP